MIGVASKTDKVSIEMLIRDKRKQLKITQDQMARRVGVSRETYRSWEKGDGLTISKLHMIGEIMNVEFAIVMFQ